MQWHSKHEKISGRMIINKKQRYPKTNKSFRFRLRPWVLACSDDLSKWRVFFAFATSIFFNGKARIPWSQTFFSFPGGVIFLQAPLESGLFYRNILCGEKCCLTATADWIGRLGRGLVKGFLRWVGHLFTFWWEGHLFMCRLETLSFNFALVSKNITVRWNSLKIRLNNEIFIYN